MHLEKSRLYRILINSISKLPDIIIGDFDSIDLESREFFESKKVEINYRVDPTTSDFEKSLYIALERISALEQNEASDFNHPFHSNIIIVGASGGRFDHTLNVYNISSKYCRIFKETTNASFYLLGESTLSMFLDKKAANAINFGKWENTAKGFSLTSLSGKAQISICSFDKEKKKYEEGKYCKYYDIMK